MNDLDNIGARCTNALWRIGLQVDARCDKALKVLRAIAERDRRAIGQMTRMDYFWKRINK
jgi:hypothetical protein